MANLQNKIALITGGNSGIGLATAQRFVEEGATVIITGRNAQTLEEAKSKIGKNIFAVQCDVSKLNELDDLYAYIKKDFGRLDILFANAGVARSFMTFQASEENYDEVMDINVKGLFFTVQKAIPLLSQGASIILNASISQQKATPGISAYAASKAAVRAFARVWILEFADKNIRVNSISPGPIETPIFTNSGMNDEQYQALKSQIEMMVPMSRFGKAEEIANVVNFLASDESSYITGVDLCVDGGTAQV